MFRSESGIIDLLEGHIIHFLDFEFTQDVLMNIRLGAFDFLVQYIFIKEAMIFLANRVSLHVHEFLCIEPCLSRLDYLIKANVIDLGLGKDDLAIRLSPLYILVK